MTSNFDNVKSWAFSEAKKVLSRVNNTTPQKGYVLFETGYGPSGLPHIGTFGEVVRTSMVRKAFQEMSDIPTRLICFSDDRDGLRKVPDNVPNRELLEANKHLPLTSVPDPFGTHASFGEHNNSKLMEFLDSYGFNYEFESSTAWYTSGRFNDMLMQMVRHYDEIQELMLSTLGADRRETYSIFFPISPASGKVLQVPILEIDKETGTIIFRDLDNALVTTNVRDGAVKLQWKADWAGRWYALDVDYEMYGKDLIPTADISKKILNILGRRPPEGFFYELFLDENNQKISKGKGNGLSIETWLRYGNPESLSYFMYQTPQRAKALSLSVVPKMIDGYLDSVSKLNPDDDTANYDNPAWFIETNSTTIVPNLTFNLLLNLVSIANTEDKNVLLGYIQKYTSNNVTFELYPYVETLVNGAIAYYQDFIKPNKVYREVTREELSMMTDLLGTLMDLSDDSTEEEIQAQIYEVGKRHYPTNQLRQFFKAVYQIMLGQDDGPRLGAFVKLYGRQNTIEEIKRILRA